VYETEQDLISACIEGDPDAWSEFKTRYRRLIRAAAVRTSSVDDTIVDDLEATVYQKLLEDRCRRMRAWRGRARFSTYLVQVTRNLVLDWVDTQKRTLVASPLDERPDVAGDAPDYGADEEIAAQSKALHEAIQTLPERQAIIMRLRLEGKSLREIAVLMDRPVGTISVESSRAMLRLRALLETSGAFIAGIHA
jgi:RNA polymerase sigma factor (sigma-70 family)